MSLIDPPTAANVPAQPGTVFGTSSKQPRHGREKIAAITAPRESSQAGQPPSGREQARQAGVAESTWRHWRKRVAQAGLEAETAAFFETHAGVRFLHKHFVSLLFVYGLMGSAGPSLLRLQLELSGLAPLIACSDTTLRDRMGQLLTEVAAWGERVQGELAQTLPPRSISLGVDETFFSKMVLVAMDVVSGYILLEKTSDQRDAETWYHHVKEALGGLSIEVVQVLGDRAAALRILAEDLIGAPKVDDLWHGQSAITRGTAGPLAAAVVRATAQWTAARHAQEGLADARAANDRQPRRGRPPDWAAREARAAATVAAAETARTQAVQAQETMQQAVCELGVILHPVDLATGAPQNAATVEQRLQDVFAKMTQTAQIAGLGEASFRALRKAFRCVPSWVAAVARWHSVLEERLAALGHPAAVLDFVRQVLIPVLYLTRVISQTSDAARRRELRAVRAPLAAVLANPTGPWRTLPLPIRYTLLNLAQDAVDLFQRATGCVEGRNGYLSLHHHHWRGLNDIHLRALTVVHNFILTRRDRTTAAVRFFGRAPDQPLFDHLCEVLPLPARPRRRQTLQEDFLFMNAA